MASRDIVETGLGLDTRRWSLSLAKEPGDFSAPLSSLVELRAALSREMSRPDDGTHTAGFWSRASRRRRRDATA